MRAGMDDYVAKPVRGRTLERTLDRWAVSGREVEADGEGDGGSECAGEGRGLCTGRESESGSSSSRLGSLSGSSEVGKRVSQVLTIPDEGVVGGGGKEEDEEERLGLRVGQLAEAAGGDGKGSLGPCAAALTEGQELTVENVGRLEKEVGSGDGDGDRGESENDTESQVGSRSEVGEGLSEGVSESEGDDRHAKRPQVKRWPDSQRTITGLE